MKFTQAEVKSLVIPKEKLDRSFPEHIVFDDDMPGFGVRVLPGRGGEPHRSYIAQYKFGPKHRRITIGNVAKISLEDARKQAKKIFGKLAHDTDPANEKKKVRGEAGDTFDAAIKEYLAVQEKELRPRSYTEIERHLNEDWKSLHSMALASIEGADVSRQLAVIAKRGNTVANRARASLSAFFRWAIGENKAGGRLQNPVAGSNKKNEASRDRVLTDAEMASIWLACTDGDYGRIVQLLMLTGCRREEIGALGWSEIDLEAKTISLPGNRTKNGHPHIVPLSDRALSILKTIPRQKRKHVFGSGQGGYGGWSKSKEDLDSKCKVKDWTLHDLRRTAARRMADIGIQPHVIEAVINHVSGHKAGVAGIYNRSTYEPEKKAALDAWANHLETVMGPKAVLVKAVPLEGAGAEGPRATFAERLAGAGGEMSQRPSIKGKVRRDVH